MSVVIPKASLEPGVVVTVVVVSAHFQRTTRTRSQKIELGIAATIY